jgi:hypothetical protein
MTRAWSWLFTVIAGSAAGVYIGVQIADAALK